MREIKFRAWDKENEKLLYWEDILDINFEIGESYPVDFPMKEFTNGWVWQQYTGLKDKNGVDIYEGDILRSDSGGIVIVCELNPFDDCFTPSQTTQSIQSSIVIGNIYENQELIIK